MVPIPTRTALAAMQRPDIQRLCKDNNIKANMRTEEMIDALCGLATNGKQQPRIRRASSVRTVSHVSRPSSRASVKSREASPKKAPQLQDLTTEDEPALDTTTPAAPTTRRKAKDLQIHLGKGRPVLAGGTGARAITKRRGKASAVVSRKHDSIPEEEEPATVADTEAIPHPQSPAQLPTPAPSHPSHSLPSAHQIAALEARVMHLEGALQLPKPDLNLQGRLCDVEASLTTIQAYEARIEAATQHAADVESQLSQHTARLVAELDRLKAENDALRRRVKKLEDREQAESSSKNDNLERPTTGITLEVGGVNNILDRKEMHRDTNPLQPGSPAAPSPAQPTLGKRVRSDGTPGADTEDSTEAIERVVRPMRKRARVESGTKIDVLLGGPSSTSTPRGRRSDSPPKFFTEMPVPKPLARRADDAEGDINAYINLDGNDEPEVDIEGSFGQSKRTGEAGPGYFGSPPPMLFPSGTSLPFPLHLAPSTPPSGPVPEMYSTPALGAPWRHTQTPPPPTPTQLPGPPKLTSQEHRDPGVGYTFRGGRRERNDRYNPYFTPGPTQHTGLTPPPALGSPAKVEDGGEDGQRLKTLYGTELEEDTRFGDFGRGLGRWEWGGGALRGGGIGKRFEK